MKTVVVRRSQFARCCAYRACRDCPPGRHAQTDPATRTGPTLQWSWGKVGTIPSTDAQVAAYLAAHALFLAVATLVRWPAATSVAHEAKSFQNPRRSASFHIQQSAREYCPKPNTVSFPTPVEVPSASTDRVDDVAPTRRPRPIQPPKVIVRSWRIE